LLFFNKFSSQSIKRIRNNISKSCKDISEIKFSISDTTSRNSLRFAVLQDLENISPVAIPDGQVSKCLGFIEHRGRGKWEGFVLKLDPGLYVMTFQIFIVLSLGHIFWNLHQNNSINGL